MITFSGVGVGLLCILLYNHKRHKVVDKIAMLSIGLGTITADLVLTYVCGL